MVRLKLLPKLYSHQQTSRFHSRPHSLSLVVMEVRFIDSNMHAFEFDLKNFITVIPKSIEITKNLANHNDLNKTIT